MNVSEQLIIAGLGFITTIAGAWAVVKYRLDRDEKEDAKKDIQNEKDHDVLFSLVREIKQLYTAHEKESSQIRLDFERRFGQHDTNIQVNQSQYAEILKRLDGLDHKFDKLEGEE